jgi:hypothetical protein
MMDMVTPAQRPTESMSQEGMWGFVLVWLLILIALILGVATNQKLC